MRITQDAFNSSDIYGVSCSVPASQVIEGGEMPILKPEVGAVSHSVLAEGSGLRDLVCVTTC